MMGMDTSPGGGSGSRRPATLRRRNPRSRRRVSTQMMVLLAVLADGATPSIASAAAAAASAAAARTVASGEEGRSAAMLDPCGAETAACVQDAHCRDCEARRMGQGGVGGAEPAGCGGSRPGVSWHESISHSLLSGVAGSSSKPLCEDVGAVACGGMTAALGAVGAEEGYATASENRCRDSRVMKELLACRMASVGCELEDAPCVPRNLQRLKRREAYSQSVDGEGYRHARSQPPGEAVVERGGEERAREERAELAAAAAAALAGGVSPTTPVEGVVPAPLPLPLPAILKARRTARILRSKSTDKRHSRRATLSNDDSGESSSSSSSSSSDSDSVDPCVCDGVVGGGACCSATCGTCGGSGCSSRGDDGEECCAGSIIASGVLCSETGWKSPCVVVEDDEGDLNADSGDDDNDEDDNDDNYGDDDNDDNDDDGGGGGGSGGGGSAEGPAADTPAPSAEGAPEAEDQRPAADTPAPSDKGAPETNLTRSPVGESAPSSTSSAGLTSSSTASWSPSPSTVPSAAPSTAPSDLPGGDVVGFVVGSLSAEGVSDALLNSLGVAGVVRQVVCSLGPCPLGGNSVIVEVEVTAMRGAASRMLVTVGARAKQSQSQSHQQQEMMRRVWNRAPRHHQLEAGIAATSSQERGPRRRRLGDIDAVEFNVPIGEGMEGDDGELLTGSQQAAAFMNNVADPAVLSSLATDLGLDVEGLSLSNLAFCQGQECAIRKEFGVGSLELSGFSTSGGDDVTLGYHTWLLAIALASIPAFIAWCIYSYVERKRAQDESWTGKPIILTAAGRSQAGVPAVFAYGMKKSSSISEGHVYGFEGATNDGDGGGFWRAGWGTGKETATGRRQADRKVKPALALIDRDRDDMCSRSSCSSQGGFTFDNPMHGGDDGDRRLYGDVESTGRMGQGGGREIQPVKSTRQRSALSTYAMAGVAADNPTHAWAGATGRVQGGGPCKELEDEAQWPGRKMRKISGSSLGLSEQPLPTVAETDYSSEEGESESDRPASSFSSNTSSDTGDRDSESSSDTTDDSGGGGDNSKVGGGVSATSAEQPREPLLRKNTILSQVVSFDSIFDQEPECRNPGCAKASGKNKTNGGSAKAGEKPQADKENSNRSVPGREPSDISPSTQQEQQQQKQQQQQQQQQQQGQESRPSPTPVTVSESVRVRSRGLDSARGTDTAAAVAQQASVWGDDRTSSSKSGGARRFTAACQNALRKTALVLRVEGAASPAQSEGEDAAALLREHGNEIWGSGDVEAPTWQMKDVHASGIRKGLSSACVSRGEHDGGRDGGSGDGDGEGYGGHGQGGGELPTDGGSNDVGDHPVEPPLLTTQGDRVKVKKVVPVTVHRRVRSTGSDPCSSDYSNESLSPVSKQRRQSTTMARITSCSSIASQAFGAPSVCSAMSHGSRVFGSGAGNRTYLGDGGGGSWYGGSSVGSTSSFGRGGGSFSGDGSGTAGQRGGASDYHSSTESSVSTMTDFVAAAASRFYM